MSCDERLLSEPGQHDCGLPAKTSRSLSEIAKLLQDIHRRWKERCLCMHRTSIDLDGMWEVFANVEACKPGDFRNSLHWYIIVPGRQAPAITRTSASRQAGFPTAKFSAREANCHLLAPRLSALRLFSSPKSPAYYNSNLLFGPPFIFASQACQVAT